MPWTSPRRNRARTWCSPGTCSTSPAPPVGCAPCSGGRPSAGRRCWLGTPDGDISPWACSPRSPATTCRFRPRWRRRARCAPASGGRDAGRPGEIDRPRRIICTLQANNGRGTMADDELDRLIAELTRYMRLMPRAKAFLGSGEAGAGPSALLLLPPLVHMGPLRVTDLADLKQSDPSTVSRQAAQLVRAGLAHKEPDPADGRASRLAATPEGEAACARLMG